MKMKKIKNQYIKMFIFMFLGAITGLVTALVCLNFNKNIKHIVSAVTLYTSDVQIFIAIILALVTLYFMNQSSKFMKQDDGENDEIIVKLHKSQNYAIMFNNINVITSIILFGLTVGQSIRKTIISIIIIMTVVIFTSIINIKMINLVKKADNTKKGDPMDWNFESVWLNSCDEAEKYAAYKISYKVFVINKHIVLSAIVIAIISKLYFHTGNLPIILTGLIFLIDITAYTVYSVKSKKINNDR